MTFNVLNIVDWHFSNFLLTPRRWKYFILYIFNKPTLENKYLDCIVERVDVEENLSLSAFIFAVSLFLVSENCVAMTTRQRFIMKNDPIWNRPITSRGEVSNKRGEGGFWNVWGKWVNMKNESIFPITFSVGRNLELFSKIEH